MTVYAPGRNRQIRSVKVVADTSALLQDIRHFCENESGAIHLLATLGGVVVPMQMIDEVESRLGKLVSTRVPEARLLQAWDQYRDLLNPIDVRADHVGDEVGEALRKRDSSDLPLIAAAQALGPPVVILTADSDLTSLGLAPGIWLHAARLATDVAMVDSSEYAAGFSIVTLIRLIYRGAVLARTNRTALAGWVMLGVVAVYLISDAERRERLVAAGGRVVDTYSQLLRMRRDALSELQSQSPNLHLQIRETDLH